MTPDLRALVDRLGSAAVVMEFLPEQPGYNGSVLIIDDVEASKIAKELSEAVAALRSAADQLDAQKAEIDVAVWMLAEWCVDVAVNGTGWDDWGENYKNAMYRPGPLREQLDKAIAEVKKQRGIEK